MFSISSLLLNYGDYHIMQLLKILSLDSYMVCTQRALARAIKDKCFDAMLITFWGATGNSILICKWSQTCFLFAGQTRYLSRIVPCCNQKVWLTTTVLLYQFYLFVTNYRSENNLDGPNLSLSLHQVPGDNQLMCWRLTCFTYHISKSITEQGCACTTLGMH